MCRIPLVCVVWFFLVSGGTFSAETSNLQFSRSIGVPEIEREELVAVTLDSDVYADTREGFADLRLLNRHGAEVPYVIRKVVATRIRVEPEYRTVSDPSARPLDDGGLEITFHLDPDRHRSRPNGVRLVSPLRDFEHRIRVFSSTDGEAWNLLVEDGLIFDYTRFMDVRSVEFDLPEGSAEDFPRHFRIVIDDVTQEQQSQLMELTRQLVGDDETSRAERTAVRRQPFRIDRIEVRTHVGHEEVASERHTSYPLRMAEVHEDDERQQTVVTVESSREPITRIRLAIPTRNFSRTVHVEGLEQRGPRDTWRNLGSATLSRIDFRDLQREELEIAVPASRFAQYRLVIENRDSPPLEVTGAIASGLTYEVVFLAEPEQEYQLVYGSSEAKAPRYDTVAIEASLRQGFQPVGATLDETVEREEVPIPGEPLPLQLLKDTRAIFTVIVVLVALLAWGLYSASRRVDSLEK